MGFKPRPRKWVTWLNNNTDRRDSEPFVAIAKTEAYARRLASEQLKGRFTLGNTYTLSEFHKWYPGWRGLI